MSNMRSWRRYFAHKKMEKLGWVRINHKEKDGQSKFSRNWRSFI